MWKKEPETAKRPPHFREKSHPSTPSAPVSSDRSGGRVTVRVMGYNLGATVNDIVMVSIRGVKCSTLRRESSNSLACVSGHPALTVDNGEVGDRLRSCLTNSFYGSGSTTDCALLVRSD